MKSKIIGIWDVYWKNQGFSFPSDQIGSDKIFSVQTEVLNYLNNGHKIISRRSISRCVITGKIIGSPTVFCDNYFVWSLEYIHYLELGLFSINSDLLKNIELNNFIVPELTEEYLFGINQILSSVGFPPLSSC